MWRAHSRPARPELQTPRPHFDDAERSLDERREHLSSASSGAHRRGSAFSPGTRSSHWQGACSLSEVLVVKLPFKMLSAWFLGSPLALAIVALPAQAGAAPSDAGRFGYRAPAECPSGADFSAQVATRTAVWLAPSSSFAVTVAIDRSAQGFVGRITFARAEQPTVRELQAADCNELVQALAFIVAVLVDPQASVTPLAAPVEPPMSLASPTPASPPPSRALAARSWFIAGPEAAFETPLTHYGAIAERLFFGLGRGERTLALSSARLSLGRLGAHASSAISAAQADFVLETARLEGCLFRVGERGLALEPCPFVELGRLQAVGLHRGGNVTSNQLWASVGLALRPTWTVSRRLVLGVGLGLELPLDRYRFAFTGEPELTRTPDAAFEASLSLGLRFP
jgi:hypothetical protein